MVAIVIERHWFGAAWGSSMARGGLPPTLVSEGPNGVPLGDRGPARIGGEHVALGGGAGHPGALAGSGPRSTGSCQLPGVAVGPRSRTPIWSALTKR